MQSSVINRLNQTIEAENCFRNSEIWSEVHPTKNNLEELALLSIHSKRKIWWLGKCGHEWDALVQHRAAKGFTRCPVCSNTRFAKGVNDMATRYPELMDEWDLELNGEASEFSISSKSLFHWIGRECGHRYKQMVSGKINGKGCPICGGYRILSGFNDFATLRPVASKNIDANNSDIDTSSLALRSTRIVNWQCNKCNQIFTDSVRKMHDKPGVFCHKCRRVKSRLELLVKCYLEQEGIAFVQWTKPIYDHTSDRKIEIDFLLKDASIGIEVQDFATHSRFSDTELLTGKFAAFVKDGSNIYKKGPAAHARKRLLAKEQLGIDIIDVWQDDLFTDEWKVDLLSRIQGMST